MVILPRWHWKQPRSYDRELYKQRNLIERCFNRLKQFRRFSTCYGRTVEAFRSCTALASAWIRPYPYVDTARGQLASYMPSVSDLNSISLFITTRP